MISSRVTSGTTRWSSTAGDEPRPGRRRDPPDAPGALRLIPERFSSIDDIVPEMAASVEGPGARPTAQELGFRTCDRPRYPDLQDNAVQGTALRRRQDVRSTHDPSAGGSEPRARSGFGPPAAQEVGHRPPGPLPIFRACPRRPRYAFSPCPTP